MLFNSLEFLFVFLPITLLAFFLLARVEGRYAIAALTVASLAFYSYWDIRFLPVLSLSILFNFSMALWMASATSKRRVILAAAITGNLGALYFYKYLDFSILSLNAALNLDVPLPSLALPLGISFFTFTQIAYLVDVYQRKAETSRLIDYVLFVTYFPHLIAGPILHHAQMMPQFKDTRVLKPDATAFAGGLLFLTIGLVKKIFVADGLAGFASPVFAVDASTGMGAAEAWAGALAYTLQLYFDFSGYCDMALGISLMFNIRLPLNFASPYKATSIIDFWRRWHMTLSQFLRDYLYIPLGGNRFGKTRRYINLFITMLLGGLWHGANWTFVAWGCLHGLYLILNHGFIALRQRFSLPALPVLPALVLTFLAVTLAWVPFRAGNLSQAVDLWQAMLNININGSATLSGIKLSQASTWIAVGLIVVFCLPNSQTLVERFQARLQAAPPQPTQWLLAGALLGLVFSLTVMSIGHVSEFLYFQF